MRTYIVYLWRSDRIYLFLEHHDSIAKGAVGIASSHRSERLKEGKAISTLRDGKSPQRRILYKRPRYVPIAVNTPRITAPLVILGRYVGTYHVLETSLLISKGFEKTLSPACFA